MKPIPTNKTIPKFRVVLSVPEMEALLCALHKDLENLIDNAELIGWLSKQKRKAEFGIKEASHSSGPSVLTAKSEAIVQQVQEDNSKRLCEAFMIGENLSDEETIQALQFKAENVLVYGVLTAEESAVLNEAMTKKLFGGL